MSQAAEAPRGPNILSFCVSRTYFRFLIETVRHELTTPPPEQGEDLITARHFNAGSFILVGGLVGLGALAGELLILPVEAGADIVNFAARRLRTRPQRTPAP